jgi:hypothetical protein
MVSLSVLARITPRRHSPSGVKLWPPDEAEMKVEWSSTLFAEEEGMEARDGRVAMTNLWLPFPFLTPALAHPGDSRAHVDPFGTMVWPKYLALLRFSANHVSFFLSVCRSTPCSLSLAQKQMAGATRRCRVNPEGFFLTAWVSHPRCSGGQHYTLQNSYVETLQHILPNIPDNGTIDSWLPLAQNREQWKTLGTEWIKRRQALTIYQYGPHLRWHPRSSVPLVLTRHSSPILNERWTRSYDQSFYVLLLCYGLTTILRSRALHRVLFSAIECAWRSYMFVIHAL